MSNSSIWPIDQTLSGATTSGQSGLGSNGNDGVLHIPQSSNISGASTADCLVLYPRHSLPLYRDAVSVFYWVQRLLDSWGSYILFIAPWLVLEPKQISKNFEC